MADHDWPDQSRRANPADASNDWRRPLPEVVVDPTVPDDEIHLVSGDSRTVIRVEPVALRLVILESPYAGDVEANLAYCRTAMADCLHRGEAPFASHALYTQPGVLDDDQPTERALGIAAGLAWGRAAEATVVYTDRGVTSGMRQGVDRARAEGRPVEYRTLPKGPSPYEQWCNRQAERELAPIEAYDYPHTPAGTHALIQDSVRFHLGDD